MVRPFEAFRQLEEQIKALLTSLPLVADLHHPSMRDRHWRQLMKATGKHFVLDDHFSLGDMLALNLHECVDVVSETVERAQKELVIEKALTKIEDTWTGLVISFAPFSAESQVLNLVVDEQITETLENDNMALQNMNAARARRARGAAVRGARCCPRALTRAPPPRARRASMSRATPSSWTWCPTGSASWAPWTAC